MEDVWQKAQKQDEVGSMGEMNMSSLYKLVSTTQSNVTQQSSELMEKMRRQSENKDGTGLNATELKEVCLGQQESDSMNVAWEHSQGQIQTQGSTTGAISLKTSEEEKAATREEKPKGVA